MTSLKIAHISDTHLGYETYPAKSIAGNNQRGEDVVRVFKNAVDDIVAWDPDLVIHAGDALDKPRSPNRYMLVGKNYLSRLAAIRPDGTRRQVVVVAGNHEQPRSKKEACWLELLSDVPGLTVSTAGYDKIRFRGLDVPSALTDVIVHAVSHDSLRHIDQSQVEPHEGALNVFSSHGVAAASDLFKRAQGREYPIVEDLLLRDWDYVALGHWHKRGPITMGPLGIRNNIWYAGSLENMGFRDLKVNGQKRGYLRVEFDDRTPRVTAIDLPTRPMFRLPEIDGRSKTASEITEEAIANIRTAQMSSAIVEQSISGVTRELYALVDTRELRRQGAAALHFQITARYQTDLEEGPSRVAVDGDTELRSAVLAAVAATAPLVHQKAASTIALDTLAAQGAAVASLDEAAEEFEVDAPPAPTDPTTPPEASPQLEGLRP